MAMHTRMQRLELDTDEYLTVMDLLRTEQAKAYDEGREVAVDRLTRMIGKFRLAFGKGEVSFK